MSLAQRSLWLAKTVIFAPTAVTISPTAFNTSMSFTALAISRVIMVVMASRSHSEKSQSCFGLQVMRQYMLSAVEEFV